MRSSPQWMMRRQSFPMHPETLRVEDTKGLFNRPELYLSYEEAWARSQQDNSAEGVGYCMLDTDPYFFIDVDDCLVNGEWTNTARHLVNQFNGAWVELSNSGHGLHIYGKCTGTIPPHCCKVVIGGTEVELYSKFKFVHVTHKQARGDMEYDCTAALHRLITDHFPPKAEVSDAAWTTEPRNDWDGHDDDEKLLAAAFNAKTGSSVFGTKAGFGDLWEERVNKLAVTYPPKNEKDDYDRSQADAALAQHLAFWTGADCERVERLMRRSKLHRPKWDKHGSYLRATITRACGLQVDVHNRGASRQDHTPVPTTPGAPTPGGIPSAPKVPAPPIDVSVETVTQAGAQMRNGTQTMDNTNLYNHFKGCVYVQSDNRVMIPGGELLDQPRFRARYGGWRFAVDRMNETETTNAWTAFTESQAFFFPKVDGRVFRPGEEPGAIVKKEGKTYVNTYFPPVIKRQKGDPSRVLRHLATLLPNERDQQIIIAYMAACVQHAGTKFQWCPFIQGAEGNGKTLFSRVIKQAVGHQYSHFPRPQHFDQQFNSWQLDKIFIGVEDVYVPESKNHIMEILKPMITGEDQEIRKMQTDGYMAEICCNYLLNSNHKDGLRKTLNDRRIAPFFCAQQSAQDLVRDRLTDDYFVTLYNWLRDEGYAVMTDFLSDYDIPDEFNPAGSCQRAPETSSTKEAIHAGLPSLEQAILEAIEEGQTGFSGGWVSSVALGHLLEKMRASRQIPPNKRRQLMQTLGYDWHPGLRKGRVGAPSEIDGGNRPTLFVKVGSPESEGVDGDDILCRYLSAQRGLNPFAA